jgi:integrase
MKRVRVEKFLGVYAREHATRRHNGKSDRCFEITYKTSSGRKIWEKVGWVSEGYSAAMAANIRGERLRTLRHGDELPSKKKTAEMTFGELWKKYHEWALANRKSFVAETNRYQKHIRPMLANLPISEITPLLLDRLKDDLVRKGYSSQTVKHILVLVRQVMNKGIVWGLHAGRNPINQIKLPQPNNRRERFLTPEEIRELFEELEKVSIDQRDIALLSLHTGLRAGEIFGLRWVDVDLEQGVISILDPKAGKAQKAFMTATIKAMLNRRMMNSEILPNGLIFKSRKGTRIREVSDSFSRIVERLGLNRGIDDRRQRVCFHTLRHTFASWLALSGKSILLIKELLRHSSVTLSERYSHLLADQKQQAITVFDEKMAWTPRLDSES